MQELNNIELYNKVRSVPKEALKDIQAGRLKGKSDINPMWRLKTLTENFGICGFGWKYEITKQWLETGGNNEISAFVNINLYVKINDKWSDAIQGIGGSSFVANEKNGLYTNDECFKMALTDAISVACKSLGFGADVYWGKDSTKYDDKKEDKIKPIEQKQINKSEIQGISANISEAQKKRLFAIAKGNYEVAKAIIKKFGYDNSEDIKKSDYEKICLEVEKEITEIENLMR